MSMEKLIQLIRSLNKNCKVRDTVNSRMQEFQKNGKGTADEIFKELCFCILTANFVAEKCIKIQKEIDDGFLTMSEPQLAEKLKESGHRFPNTRAKYIIDARIQKKTIKEIISSQNNKKSDFTSSDVNVAHASRQSPCIRDWLITNIKGIGHKEASHFLRNIGFKDFAIIDFHIVDLLTEYDLIKRPKSLGKNKYLEIEMTLKKLSEKLDMNLAELDLYLWYTETGKILK